MNETDILDQLSFDDSNEPFYDFIAFRTAFGSCLFWAKIIFACTLVYQLLSIPASIMKINAYKADTFLPDYYKYYSFIDLLTTLIFLVSLYFFWKFIQNGAAFLKQNTKDPTASFSALFLYFCCLSAVSLVRLVLPYLIPHL